MIYMQKYVLISINIEVHVRKSVKGWAMKNCKHLEHAELSMNKENQSNELGKFACHLAWSYISLWCALQSTEPKRFEGFPCLKRQSKALSGSTVKLMCSVNFALPSIPFDMGPGKGSRGHIYLQDRTWRRAAASLFGQQRYLVDTTCNNAWIDWTAFQTSDRIRPSPRLRVKQALSINIHSVPILSWHESN